MSKLPSEVITRNMEFEDSVELVSIVKYDKSASEDLLATFTSKINGYLISKPVYFDFLIEKCIIEPESLLKRLSSKQDYYRFLANLITDICELNPFLNYNSMYVDPHGILSYAVEENKGFKKLVDNIDWNFPTISLKYSHNSFADVGSLDYTKNFIVKHNTAEMYLVVKSLDEDDINYLFKIKERLSSTSYKKYFCYYSIYHFYYVYSCFVDFNWRDIPEVYDDLYRMVIAVNPNPFIKRLVDENDEDDSSEGGLDLHDMILASNFLSSIPPLNNLFANMRQDKKDESKLVKKQKKDFETISRKEIDDLKEKLAKNIYGQDSAIDALIAAIKRAKVGLRKEESPVCSFIFTGPTGSGKTELSKLLCYELMGDKNAFVRIDCSEYQQAHEVSKLIGSPPGYVGHDEGGILVKKVIEYPFAVVLFDEIEKAHPKMYDILLQILDAGILTDSHGNTASFNNCMIIFTSNLASRDISVTTKPFGFSEVKEVTTSNTNISSIVNNALKKHFRPEFLGRIDEIIVFNSLGKDVCEKIVNKELSFVSGSLKTKGIDVTFDNSLIGFLLDKGFDAEYGARPIIKTIKKNVSDRIADYLLNNEETKTINVKIVDKETVQVEAGM